MLSLQVIVPLASAAIYAVAALALKRATTGGVGPWRVSFVTNWLQAVLFLPLFFVPNPHPFSWAHVGHAAITGACFFVGQVFTFLAISRGDVSVATPVLGTKVVFVALLSVVIGGAHVPGRWWFAALLTAVATALMGGGKTAAGQATFARSLVYGFSASLAFSLTDVCSQMWAPAWGFTHFAPVVFLTVALLSFGLVPYFSGPLWEVPRASWGWLLSGASLLALQAGGVAWAIMTFGAATMVNILYGSRGMWSVVLVWLVGHWFGNEERGHGHAVLGRRLAGSALLLVAIVLVVG